MKKQLPPPVDLLRCVRSPDGALLVDLHYKLPSKKPLWLGAFPASLHRAFQHKLPDLWFSLPTDTKNTQHQFMTVLERAINDTLALLNKSGQCILGIDQVKNAREADILDLVIIAKNAGESDASRLIDHPQPNCPCYLFGTKKSLGKPFGRRSQTYIGIQRCELSEKLGFFLRCNTRFTAANTL